MVHARSAGDHPGMDTFTALIFAGLAIATSIAIALSIRALAGDGSDASLADFMRPIVAAHFADAPHQPVVREGEHVPWKFAPPAVPQTAFSLEHGRSPRVTGRPEAAAGAA
jgi:hypothetical protein